MGDGISRIKKVDYFVGRGVEDKCKKNILTKLSSLILFFDFIWNGICYEYICVNLYLTYMLMLENTSIPYLIPWLALDIDETLSWTVWFWMEQMQNRFWNPENLTILEMMKKYRYTFNVPYRNTDEANEWIKKEIHTSVTQEKIELEPGAFDGVQEIQKHIPISCYITVRPEVVREWSNNRLKKYWFPDLPIIMKPMNVDKKDGNQRKARVLEHLSDIVVWIVDDNPWLIDHLDDAYEWVVFMYNNVSKKEAYEQKKNYIPCPTRDDVVSEVWEHFSI